MQTGPIPSSNQQLFLKNPLPKADVPSLPPVDDSFQAEVATDPNYDSANLLRSLAAAGRPYYDESKDKVDVAQYYAVLQSPPDDPKEFYAQLSDLVSRTHTNRYGFDPEGRLFPWIDLRPSLRLQSIYATENVQPDSPIQSNSPKDFKIKERVKVPGRVRASGDVGPMRWVNQKLDLRQQAKEWLKVIKEGPSDALQIATRLAAIEGRFYYNAEHSVPQHFFNHDKVPKGDMHHLFACNRDANSRRGCRPYTEVEEVPENRSLQGWAPKKVNQFEPDAGKGEVARATLYFLLRYPGEIGDGQGEYTKKDVETLLSWNREFPVTLYEKHRNQAIAEVQGNRNPLIDHPEWADKIDFLQGLGAWGRRQEVSGATGLPI